MKDNAMHIRDQETIIGIKIIMHYLLASQSTIPANMWRCPTYHKVEKTK